MKRLTKKYKDTYLSNLDNCEGLTTESKSKEAEIKICDKLGQLEDIEEELGIGLERLFKLMKAEHFYIKTAYDCITGESYDFDGTYSCALIFCPQVRTKDLYYFPLTKPSFVFIFIEEENGDTCFVELKDYGKTWALTEGELK